MSAVRLICFAVVYLTAYGLRQQQNDPNQSADCLLVRADWHRLLAKSDESKVEFTMENQSRVNVLIVATERPIGFFLGTPKPSEIGQYDGWSFTGRTYSKSPYVFPNLRVLQLAPGARKPLSCAIEHHTSDFMVEFGIVWESDSESFDILKKFDGSPTSLAGVNHSFFAAMDAFEIWIRNGRNEGTKFFGGK